MQQPGPPSCSAVSFIATGACSHCVASSCCGADTHVRRMRSFIQSKAAIQRQHIRENGRATRAFPRRRAAHLMAAEEDRLWHQASTADQDGTASRAGFLRLKKVAPRLLTFG